LDIQHYATQAVCGRRYYAPLENPKHAIDIGTGTGTWLKEMAVDFPECQFLGIDLSPSKLKRPLPENCTFEQIDALKGIPHPDGSFDYVHSRFLTTAIPKDAWPKYIKECARLCAPGGWIEIVDTNGCFVNGGPGCEQFNNWVRNGLLTRGIDVETTTQLDVFLKEAGIENITVETIKAPFGKWGGVAGQLFAKDYELGCEVFKPFFVQACGATEEAVDASCKAGLEELSDGNAYMVFYIYLAQKPLA
jgi:ubiquinone/menaquinone biosynthesis C-methylase UbiE